MNSSIELDLEEEHAWFDVGALDLDYVAVNHRVSDDGLAHKTHQAEGERARFLRALLALCFPGGLRPNPFLACSNTPE